MKVFAICKFLLERIRVAKALYFEAFGGATHLGCILFSFFVDANFLCMYNSFKRNEIMSLKS